MSPTRGRKIPIASHTGPVGSTGWSVPVTVKAIQDNRTPSVAKRAVLSARKGVGPTRGTGNSTGARSVARLPESGRGEISDAYRAMRNMEYGRLEEARELEGRG